MEITKRVTGKGLFGVCEKPLNNYTELNGKESIYIIHLQKIKAQLLQFMITTLIVLILPLTTFSQLPNLGTAINFALFTTTGALGNTGTSNITGDIGTGNGAISGFGAPTVVNGNTELANSVTAQCAIDVQAAYNEIFGIPPTVVGHAPEFGNGETLPAGVYFIGGAGSLAGNLTLDAAGDPTAIFIFQFGGAFTSGVSTTVNLINGALACNVFWIAEGAIALAAITDMKGSLISNNGAISMGAGGTLEGRMLSTAGEASVYEVLITLPTCAVLPINLLSFAGYCNEQNIVLQWRTATEVNNNYFTIERSSDAINWDIIGTVAGAGNSSIPLNYTLTDMNHNEGTTYYQLKQTDFNENHKYEAIIGINKCENNKAEHFTVYPNPSTGKFKLLFSGNTSEINSIEIFNLQGQHIYSSVGFQSIVDLSNNLPGVYYIHVKHNSETISFKFMLSN